MSGGRKSAGPRIAKADAARNHWCVAVNNHGGYGRWAYLELDDMNTAGPRINAGITELLEPQSSTGTPLAGVTP